MCAWCWVSVCKCLGVSVSVCVCESVIVGVIVRYTCKQGWKVTVSRNIFPPQSPTLNPIEIVWDELDHRVKEKQPTSSQHMWELLKSIPGEAGWEDAKSVQSCHQGKGWLLWRIWNIKYIFWLFWLLHMCYFIVLMSLLLFYNVENCKNKGNPLNE